MITTADIALLMTLARWGTVMADEREAVRNLRDKLDAMLDAPPDEEEEYYYIDDDDDHGDDDYIDDDE